MMTPYSLPSAANNQRVAGETICPYCGVGCRLQLEGDLGGGLQISGVSDAPANLGRICAKGKLLGETIVSTDRLTRPLMRTDRRSPFRETDWPTALGNMAFRLRRII